MTLWGRSRFAVEIQGDVVHVFAQAAGLVFSNQNAAWDGADGQGFNQHPVLPSGFSPMPLPTRPVDLRSTCQLSVTPDFPLMVNAKIPLPFLMASLTAAGFSASWSFIASNSCEAGIFSVGGRHVSPFTCFFRDDNQPVT